MQIVAGVDRREEAHKVFSLLDRLNFTRPKVFLTKVIEELDGLGGEQLPEEIRKFFLDSRRTEEHEARQFLKRLSEEFPVEQAEYSAEVLSGNSISDQLMKFAETKQADLIAIGSLLKSSLPSLFLGSVGRSLVINARQSIIVAKAAIDQKKQLRVVCATDHSAYANRCFAVLSQWKPRGIDSIVVLSAYPKSLLAKTRTALENTSAGVLPWANAKLNELNQEAVTRLSPLARHCESRILDLPVNEAIQQTMASTGADLLILGSQGHGMLDRMTLGSVSFHQVVSENHSTLVLRV